MMRIFASWALLAGAALLIEPDPKYLAVSSTASWNSVTTNILGAPETVVSYMVAVTPDGVNLKTGADPIVWVETTRTDIGLGSIYADMVDGSYWLQVKAQDAAGNWSDWSTPVTFLVDKTRPAPPEGVSVKVIIEVDTTK